MAMESMHETWYHASNGFFSGFFSLDFDALYVSVFLLCMDWYDLTEKMIKFIRMKKCFEIEWKIFAFSNTWRLHFQTKNEILAICW